MKSTKNTDTLSESNQTSRDSTIDVLNKIKFYTKLNAIYFIELYFFRLSKINELHVNEFYYKKH